MTNRSALVRATATALYSRGVPSHVLVRWCRALGEPISTKTVISNARTVGRRIRSLGRWAKRHGHKRNYSFGRSFWKTSLSLSPLLVRVALAFNAWISFMETPGGYFDMESVLTGEKPP